MKKIFLFVIGFFIVINLSANSLYMIENEKINNTLKAARETIQKYNGRLLALKKLLENNTVHNTFEPLKDLEMQNVSQQEECTHIEKIMSVANQTITQCMEFLYVTNKSPERNMIEGALQKLQQVFTNEYKVRLDELRKLKMNSNVVLQNCEQDEYEQLENLLLISQYIQQSYQQLLVVVYQQNQQRLFTINTNNQDSKHCGCCTVQ
jgi:hypothetical protein